MYHSLSSGKSTQLNMRHLRIQTSFSLLSGLQDDSYVWSGLEFLTCLLLDVTGLRKKPKKLDVEKIWPHIVQ